MLKGEGRATLVSMSALAVLAAVLAVSPVSAWVAPELFVASQEAPDPDTGRRPDPAPVERAAFDQALYHADWRVNRDNADLRAFLASPHYANARSVTVDYQEVGGHRRIVLLAVGPDGHTRVFIPPLIPSSDNPVEPQHPFLEFDGSGHLARVGQFGGSPRALRTSSVPGGSGAAQGLDPALFAAPARSVSPTAAAARPGTAGWPPPDQLTVVEADGNASGFYREGNGVVFRPPGSGEPRRVGDLWSVPVQGNGGSPRTVWVLQSAGGLSAFAANGWRLGTWPDQEAMLRAMRGLYLRPAYDARGRRLGNRPLMPVGFGRNGFPTGVVDPATGQAYASYRDGWRVSGDPPPPPVAQAPAQPVPATQPTAHMTAHTTSNSPMERSHRWPESLGFTPDSAGGWYSWSSASYGGGQYQALMFHSGAGAEPVEVGWRRRVHVGGGFAPRYVIHYHGALESGRDAEAAPAALYSYSSDGQGAILGDASALGSGNVWSRPVVDERGRPAGSRVLIPFTPTNVDPHTGNWASIDRRYVDIATGQHYVLDLSGYIGVFRPVDAPPRPSAPPPRREEPPPVVASVGPPPGPGPGSGWGRWWGGRGPGSGDGQHPLPPQGGSGGQHGSGGQGPLPPQGGSGGQRGSGGQGPLPPQGGSGGQRGSGGQGPLPPQGGSGGQRGSGGQGPLPPQGGSGGQRGSGGQGPLPPQGGSGGQRGQGGRQRPLPPGIPVIPERSIDGQPSANPPPWPRPPALPWKPPPISPGEIMTALQRMERQHGFPPGGGPVIPPWNPANGPVPPGYEQRRQIQDMIRRSWQEMQGPAGPGQMERAEWYRRQAERAERGWAPIPLPDQPGILPGMPGRPWMPGDSVPGMPETPGILPWEPQGPGIPAPEPRWTPGTPGGIPGAMPGGPGAAPWMPGMPGGPGIPAPGGMPAQGMGHQVL